MIIAYVFIAVCVFAVIKVAFTIRQDNIAKKHWKSLPTVDEYIAAIRTDKSRGICCSKCGSNQIWEQRLIGGKQIHYCKQCKTDLYGTGHKKR